MLILTVQTCLGRCGTMFAAELWGLEPDILLMGKGIAAGCQPIAAVLATEAVMADSDVQPGGTFAWTPAACAGALAGIDAIIAEGALDNAGVLADVAREELEPLVARHEQVGDVRVVGAWVGIEFVIDKTSIAPAPAFHAAVHHASVRRGVLGITQQVGVALTGIGIPPDLSAGRPRQVAKHAEVIAERRRPDFRRAAGRALPHGLSPPLEGVRKAPRPGLIGAVVIVLAGGALGLLASAVSSAGILCRHDFVAGTRDRTPRPRGPGRGAAFVDARPRDDYVLGHIAGASTYLSTSANERPSASRAAPHDHGRLLRGGACLGRRVSAWLAANGWRDEGARRQVSGVGGGAFP
jgi:hypothetical protein